MARAPAKARPKPARSGGKAGSLLWLGGLGCGAMVTLATPTAVLAGVLLAPALLAIAMDQAPAKPTARAVLLFGLAATVQPVVTLWRTGHQLGTAFEMASDASVLAIAWVAQGAAWLLCELTPLVIAVAMDAASRTRAARLRAARTEYEQRWGLPPAEPEA